MTSWGEEIKVNIDVAEINVKSECTGTQIIDWGRNRRNIDLFFSSYQQKKGEIASMNVDEQYEDLSKVFASNDGDSKGSPLDEKEKVSGLFSLVLPKGGYFITPVIVLLNVLVFIIMLLSGVHWMMPANESLIQWGANFRPITINGEWWRLITSTFLHIGIFHLLMNMYALVYIGLLLEPYLGKARFLAAYLITGIVGSVASISWNEMTISAGASGAIFGMYGVFIALLTTRLIDQSARKSLLISIGVFVFYSLANGMKEGIDNAAHLGGLVSGIIIGYAYYPGLIKPDRLLRPLTIGLLALVFSVGSFAVVKNLSSDLGQYESDMQEFVKLEEKALGIYRLPDTYTEEQILEEIQINGIRNWEESLRLIEKTETYKLPEVLRNRNAKLKEYCRLRIKSYEAIYKAIQEQTDRYEDEIMGIDMEIQRIINELSYVPE
jgi:rhomboid protease GluP